MTYGTLNASVPVLRKLIGQNLHLRQAYQLQKIIKRVNEELAFFQAKFDEIKMSGGTPQEKEDKLTELFNFEIQWELDPLVLSLNDDLMLSAHDLDVSEGLIEIKENKEGGK